MNTIQDQTASGGRVSARIRVPFEDGSQATVTGFSDEEVRAIADDFEARGYLVERTPAPGLVPGGFREGVSHDQ